MNEIFHCGSGFAPALGGLALWFKQKTAEGNWQAEGYLLADGDRKNRKG
jgi:hypothetical protein